MSISSLKKSNSNFVLPVVGNIRLGEKINKVSNAGKKFEMPTATSTFIIKGDTEFEKKLIYFLGTDKPSRLLVYFPQYKCDSIEEWKELVFKLRYEAYNSKQKLIFSGDDTSGVVKDAGLYKLITGKDFDGENFENIDVYPEGETWEDDVRFKDLLDKKTISLVGTLKVKIVGFDFPGVFRIVTRSKMSINRIYTYFDSLITEVGFPYLVGTNLVLERQVITGKGNTYKPYIIVPSISPDWSEYAKNLLKKHEDTMKIKENMMSMLYNGVKRNEETKELPQNIVDEEEYIGDEEVVIGNEYDIIDGENTEEYFKRVKVSLEELAKNSGVDFDKFISDNKYSDSEFKDKPKEYIQSLLTKLLPF